MKIFFPKAILFLFWIFFGCQSANEQQRDPEIVEAAAFRIKFEALATLLVDRAELQPGERVILVANPGEFDSLVFFLKNKILQKEAAYLGAFSVTDVAPQEWTTSFTKIALENPNGLAESFQSVDLGIMLPGADTTHLPYAAMKDVLRRGKGRTIHFHWAGAYQMNNALLARSTLVDELYQAALLETDYEKLADKQALFENVARANNVRITTPAGTDIRFSIGNRPVTKQDGNASKARSNTARNFIDREIELPAGAVRVAPIEESVNGKIVFPDMVWSGNTLVKGLTMKFRQGKVDNLIAAYGLEVVKEELRSNGPGASSFREVVVGFNPWLSIPEIGQQWIPYYGYGAGVIRLSLGDNSELGGNVTGGYVRWNFFTDATLYVGDEVWIRDGKMVKGIDP